MARGWWRAAHALLVAGALWTMMGGGRVAAGDAAGPPTPQDASPTALGYSEHGADTCLTCHSAQYSKVGEIFHTAHARPGDPRGPFGPGGLQCEACHGPAGAHVKAFGVKPMGIVIFGPNSPTPVVRQNAMCLTCHKSNVGHMWASSAHAANQVSCADCHQIHSATDPVRVQSTEAQVCAKCHQAVSAALLEPYHHPVPEGTLTCSSCHDPHGSAARAMLVKATVNETCTSCHAQLRGPFLWSISRSARTAPTVTLRTARCSRRCSRSARRSSVSSATTRPAIRRSRTARRDCRACPRECRIPICWWAVASTVTRRCTAPTAPRVGI